MITADRITKQYATVTAVDDVSFDVARGEIFALLGPNGAGKTTLLRMVLGLMEPDSGSITFDGYESRPAPHEIGYLPEDRGLYPDVKVLDTLVHFGALRGMSRRAARDAAVTWLERMKLSDRAGEPLKALSKGNQQKVQFISAILHAPVLAVLDEPFSGLDPLNQDFFLDLFRELRADGMTIVLSAHQMQLVERIADRILVLNRGQTVLSGTLPAVRRRWTTGRRLLVTLAEAAPASFDGSIPGIEVQQVADDVLEVFVPDELELSPVLAQIGTRLNVRELESHPVTLHDVYVRSIGRHDEERV
ncbi:MAG TPA: ATP-binding cassette domain-containing protein [Longimicrobiales bacterium]|nr:ATP-binding cassette domain-containing protein [Longimicrobiales bacterium]